MVSYILVNKHDNTTGIGAMINICIQSTSLSLGQEECIAYLNQKRKIELGIICIKALGNTKKLTATCDGRPVTPTSICHIVS